MNRDKLRKLLPNGLVVDKWDLVQIIEKQERLLCDLRWEMNSVNPKMTSKRHNEIVALIRSCWK
jgi:hypothetical protein